MTETSFSNPPSIPNAPTTLFQLVYVSSALVPFSPSQLTALLEKSRRNNSKAGISGLLLYHDGNFMQLLEGDESVVRGAHAKIVDDPRHTGCITLVQKRVAHRTFPDWTMGFRDLASAEVRALDGYNTFLNSCSRGQPLPADPNRALMLLQLFRDKMR
jgi:hypothetical protein